MAHIEYAAAKFDGRHVGLRAKLNEDRHTKRIAKALGLTATGLRVLAKAAVEPDGIVKGNAYRNPGSSKVPLLAAGYIEVRQEGVYGFYGATITDAGREVVRRARAMGW